MFDLRQRFSYRHVFAPVCCPSIPKIDTTIYCNALLEPIAARYQMIKAISVFSKAIALLCLAACSSVLAVAAGAAAANVAPAY